MTINNDFAGNICGFIVALSIEHWIIALIVWGGIFSGISLALAESGEIKTGIGEKIGAVAYIGGIVAMSIGGLSGFMWLLKTIWYAV